MSAAALIATLTISAGPMRQVLLDIVNQFDIQMLFDGAETSNVSSRGVNCTLCTVDSALDSAVLGTSFVWWYDDESDSYSICSPEINSACKKPVKCRPDLGPKAPLPPCEGKSLQIGVTEL